MQFLCGRAGLREDIEPIVLDDQERRSCLDVQILSDLPSGLGLRQCAAKPPLQPDSGATAAEQGIWVV